MGYNFETVEISKGDVTDVDRLEFYTGMKKALDVFADIMSQEIDAMNAKYPTITASEIEVQFNSPLLADPPEIGRVRQKVEGGGSKRELIYGPLLEAITKEIAEEPSITPDRKLPGSVFIGEPKGYKK